MFSNYVGIPLDNKSNDDDINIIGYCLAFISLLLALRVLHLSYFKKIDGDWTDAGKARWRYCFVGAIAVAVICTPIEYLNISETLKGLLEVVISIGVAAYFYVKYYERYLQRHKYRSTIDSGSSADNNEDNAQNKP